MYCENGIQELGRTNTIIHTFKITTSPYNMLFINFWLGLEEPSHLLIGDIGTKWSSLFSIILFLGAVIFSLMDIDGQRAYLFSD